MLSWFDKTKPIEVATKPIERVPLNLKMTPLEGLKSPQWFVITPANQEEIWNRLKEQEINQVLFGITDEGYKDLAATMAEIRGHILMQKQFLEKYKEYYEPQNKETANKK